MNENERRALELIRSNPGLRDLMPRGVAIFNAGVPGLLRAGLITYAPRRCGYALTPAGRAALDSVS
jgi:hypothetical protein